MSKKVVREMPKSPGIYKEILTLKNGERLRYALSIPVGYSEGKPVPLVMALHFGSPIPVPPWYSKPFLSYIVEPGLGELDAIIVAPDCPGRDWIVPVSETAVLELMSHIQSYYPVDEQKKLITGFSMGGIGTWYMIAKHPRLFSAAVPVSSIAPQKILDDLKDIPIYAIHSDADEIFPVSQVKKIMKTLKKKGVPVKLSLISGISHYHSAKFVEPLKKSVNWIMRIWEK